MINLSFSSPFEGEVKTLVLKQNPLHLGLGNYEDVNGIIWDVQCIRGAGTNGKPVVNARQITNIPYYSTAIDANQNGFHQWLPYYFEVSKN